MGVRPILVFTHFTIQLTKPTLPYNWPNQLYHTIDQTNLTIPNHTKPNQSLCMYRSSCCSITQHTRSKYRWIPVERSLGSHTGGPEGGNPYEQCLHKHAKKTKRMQRRLSQTDHHLPYVCFQAAFNLNLQKCSYASVISEPCKRIMWYPIIIWTIYLLINSNQCVKPDLPRSQKVWKVLDSRYQIDHHRGTQQLSAIFYQR